MFWKARWFFTVDQIRLQKMLSSKQQDSFLQCDMSQAKEDVAVTFITYLINQLLAESMSSNPQPQQIKKKNSCVKLVLHSLVIGIAEEIEFFKKINGFSWNNFDSKKFTSD